jgi:hypothetical protein
MWFAARLNLYILVATYVGSAVVLYAGRRQGRPVTTFIIIAWGVAGLGGAVLTALLSPGRAFVWWGLIAVLTPLMVRALVGDLQRRHWWVAAFDVSGLGAIALSLGITAAGALG